MEKIKEKILVSTFGSLGDLYPFVALAHELNKAGYHSIIATSSDYEDYLLSEGLDFRAVRPDAQLLSQKLNMTLAEIGNEMSRNDRFLFNKIIFPFLTETYDDLSIATVGVRAIVSHSISFSARLVAEKKQIPCFTIHLSPLMFYSAYDPPHGSKIPFIRNPGNKLSASYNQLMIFLFSQLAGLWARPLSKFRHENKLNKKFGLDLLFNTKNTAGHIGLFSPCLLRKIQIKDRFKYVAGHSFHDNFDKSDCLAENLQQFLNHGDEPVIFTLGSFINRDRIHLYKLINKVASSFSLRTILLVHEDEVSFLKTQVDNNCFVASYVRHSLIFKHCRLIIHHGGIGTSGQALRSGRPQFILPFLGDQFDNAERLKRLGVGTFSPGAAITEQRLKVAFTELLTDNTYMQTAQSLGRQVSNETGAKNAAKNIINFLSIEHN